MGERNIYLYHTIKHELKSVRWRYRRWQAARRWGDEPVRIAPAVLGNAMPKSGSHLIIQVLQGLVEIGPFVNPGFPPVNRTEDNRKLPDEEVLRNIRAMRNGDIGYGYVQARPPFLDLPAGLAMVFLYRDPRDFIISQVFYATQMHAGHGMHRYYTQTLKTMEERINAAIQGVEENEEITDSPLSDVLTKYEKYTGWLSQPGVLCLRFEELIQNREAALQRLLDYMAEWGFVPKISRFQAVETLKNAIVPHKSGTYRRGKPGNWREHFSQANKALFKQVTGDLLVRLGYEKDANW